MVFCEEIESNNGDPIENYRKAVEAEQFVGNGAQKRKQRFVLGDEIVSSV